jgi:phage/plasmid-like protein (TIGR03299 family)
MAHNLATIDGKIAMAYQGQTPWHMLGTRLPDGLHSIAAGLDAASLNWTVRTEKLYLQDGAPVPMKRAVVRDTDARVLSVVSEAYQPIQYPEAFGLFQSAVEDFGLTLAAAGALGQGERAWMLFRLPTVLTPVAGDDINGYGLAVTGHDGSTCFEFRPTPIRVVCQNTLDAALGGSFGRGTVKGRIFGISHIGTSIPQQLDQARTLVSQVLQAMAQTGETFTQMAHQRLTPTEVIAYIETVFPSGPTGEITPFVAQQRSVVADLVFHGVGAEVAMSETDGVPNPWAVYNAVTEYFDHVYTGTGATPAAQQRRNVSALFGQAAAVKRLALQAATQLVAA